MEINKIVRVGVGVIVIKDGKFSMLRRKGAHGEGCWCFPGGHLEFNESIEECAAREVFEETGMKIKNLRIGPYTNDLFQEDDKHYITLFVISDHESGDLEIKEKDKADDSGWFNFSEMPKPLMVPIKNLIKQGFDLEEASAN